ncbi:hypothetical protein SAMN05216490_0140 [Mucilaginibacter mallensis]|uniref:Uncharacterized protein n=1 Tax=Mucilaginibacter mallensis TaxID=652787 RepID=A0A1H1MQW0_MUCMA|nr:hypothetical protein [Mucilaginibacter mallensis]SDR89117.1 hypothetical protein SAMN05216490_0140 [Mucilaginibacter mallensis]
MDYLEKIRVIASKLRNNGYISECEIIESLRDASSTGSELLMTVTHELLSFANASFELKSLIGADANELKDFCWSIGLEVK